MKLVFCVDDRGGMMFNSRRVSRDKNMVSDLAEIIADSVLYIEPYSEELFAETPLNIICSSTLMASAEQGDFAFVERFDPSDFIEFADELIIYGWNRKYPSELKFDKDPEALGFALADVFDFVGNSHEKITRKRYVRK